MGEHSFHPSPNSVGTHRVLTPCPTPSPLGPSTYSSLRPHLRLVGFRCFPEGVGELPGRGVSTKAAQGDALPGQDDDHGILAVVARPVPHQAEQLLFWRVPAGSPVGRQGGALGTTGASGGAWPQRMPPPSPLPNRPRVQLFRAWSQGVTPGDQQLHRLKEHCNSETKTLNCKMKNYYYKT